MLADSFGRIATDLRVSLTDRCNLRCAYCMPPEGLDWLPSPELLTDDEVARLVRVAVELLGVREVRFTGGEPLLRRGLAGIIARTAELRPRRSSGSPPVNLTSHMPSSSTPTRMSLITSSSVSCSGAGSQSRPSGGIQYAHRRLHRSVSETRRSVATRPNESASIVPA